MTTCPEFPDFKPLVLDDRDEITRRLFAYQPETSELSFGNFYIWRSYYQFEWSVYEDWLLFLGQRDDVFFAMLPIGPAPRMDVTRMLLNWLHDARGIEVPKIVRADKRLVDELAGVEDFDIEPTREHFDYVYLSENLGELAGRKYSKKRNHINKFLRNYSYTYAPLTEDLVSSCIDLAEVWCEQRSCEEDISLTHEFEGIKDALEHCAELQVHGGVIMIEGKVQAFSLGESLNDDMAVVHIEKANPEFRGIYPMINKQFVLNRWQDVTYINREQDLGEPGLRRAKESYYPHHLVEKYEIQLKRM